MWARLTLRMGVPTKRRGWAPGSRPAAGWFCCALALAGCQGAPFAASQRIPSGHPPSIRREPARQLTVGARIVVAARAQVGTVYDPAYYVLSYPLGDPPRGRGACTDVIIRALRSAHVDLQEKMHLDMKRRFSRYPDRWGRTTPDSNIDHRRVPNQICFLKRWGLELPAGMSGASLRTWRPGDLVYWKFENGLDHCGVISDKRGASGLPMVIHNCSVCAEEDCLTRWKIQGHFRYPVRSLRSGP